MGFSLSEPDRAHKLNNLKGMIGSVTGLKGEVVSMVLPAIEVTETAIKPEKTIQEATLKTADLRLFLQ